MAKLGSMTKQMPKATGTRGQLRGDVPKGQRVGGSSAVPPTATYADLGLNKKTISKAQQLADLPATAITAIASGEKTFAKVRREHKAHAVAEKVSLPDAKFRVIVADPPWKYGNAIDEAMPGTTVAESHYPCLSIPELCALPVTHKNNTASSSQRSPHVKLVADVASAMKVLAKRQQLGAEIQAKAHEIETYAMAKLGSMTKQMPKATGTRGQGRPKLGDTAVVSPKHTSPIAARKMWGFQ
jgi:hypothetical protein